MDNSMKNMVMIDWESESYPLSQDFLVVPVFALFFTALRLFLDNFIFEILARRLIFGKSHVKLDMEVHRRRKKLNKFKESAWKCIYYFSAEVLALSVTYNEPWFTKTKYFWVGPGDQVWPDLKIKLKLKFLYMFGAGFYTYSIFALLFWETRRSDFSLSMAHHIASVALLALSYIFRFYRVGSVVLAIHDASDVFMEIAKMSLYSGYQQIADVFFTLFVLFFTVLRIIYYPFWILWSTSYEVILTFDAEEHKTEEIMYYYIFNTLLFSLLFLHIYWWKLMLRMVVGIIASGKIEKDVRSDSEGEDEDHND